MKIFDIEDLENIKAGYLGYDGMEKDDLSEEKHELLEMARIGFIPIGDNKGIEVYVNTDDSGNTPHFHVRKRSSHNDFEWDICIRFDSAEYFEHGRHKGTLSSKIAKELDKMLRTVDKKDKNGSTYWEIAISEWNRNNSDVELPDDLEQPDYTMLNKTESLSDYKNYDEPELNEDKQENTRDEKAEKFIDKFSKYENKPMSVDEFKNIMHEMEKFYAE